MFRSFKSNKPANCRLNFEALEAREVPAVLQQAVRSVYLEVAAKDPALRVVDCSDPAGAMDSPEGIFAKICAQLAPILEADAEVQGL